MKAYKIYSFNNTDTYTDISDSVINDISIPELLCNNDHSPVLQGMSLETATDLRSTHLSDNKVILLTVNGGTETVKYIGYVYDSEYSYENKVYTYNILHIFDKLQAKTTSDIYDTLFGNLSDGTEYDARTSSIYSGTTAISWKDVKMYGLFKEVFLNNWFGGLTFTLDYTNLDTNSTTAFENFCVSDYCLRYLGTDFSDEELTTGTEDLVKAWDLFVELFKIFGIKFVFNYTFNNASAVGTLKLYSSDDEPSLDDWETAEADQEDVNNYKVTRKKKGEGKRFLIKQNILNIEDNIDPEDIHRYFTPLIYGIPYQEINNIIQSGSDVQIDLPQNHLIPASNNTQIRDIKILSVITGDYSVDDGEWDYSDADSIDLIDTTLEEVRYLITNLGADVGAIEACYIRHTNGVAYSTGDITLTSHGLTNETIIISDCYDQFMNWFIAGTYTHETGTGYPSAAGKYRIQAGSDTIYVKKAVAPILQTVNTNRTNDGFIRITTGTTGTAKYIISITEKDDYNPAGTGNTTVKVITATHGITAGSGDTLHINNTGLDDYDGNSWTEDNTATDLESGEYRVIDANTLYLYDDGEPDLDPAKLKPLFPKYQTEDTIQAVGITDKTINWRDYLVLYRPSYSTDGDWKEDWWTVDMSHATYNILQKTSLIDWWWLYSQDTSYAPVKGQELNIDDSPTTSPNIKASKKIVWKVDSQSIDISQEASE